MLYVISIALSLLGGFVCGALFFRNNQAKLQDIEAKAKAEIESLRKK